MWFISLFSYFICIFLFSSQLRVGVCVCVQCLCFASFCLNIYAQFFSVASSLFKTDFCFVWIVWMLHHVWARARVPQILAVTSRNAFDSRRMRHTKIKQIGTCYLCFFFLYSRKSLLHFLFVVDFCLCTKVSRFLFVYSHYPGILVIFISSVSLDIHSFCLFFYTHINCLRLV